MSKVRLGFVRFDNAIFSPTLETLTKSLSEGTFQGSIRLANSWCVVLAETNEEFRNSLNSEGLTLPDGWPPAMFLNLLGHKTSRFRGYKVFTSLIESGVTVGLRHAFVGGTVSSMERMIENLRNKYPSVIIVGALSPKMAPLDEETLSQVVDFIGASQPDVVWVGLGTPKQDILGAAIFRETGIPSIGIGAVFDFVSGSVRAAPRWISAIGFEWLFRLFAEPKRLWRRYVFGNARFLWVCLLTLLGRRR